VRWIGAKCYPASWRDCVRHILKAVAVVSVRFFQNPANLLDLCQKDFEIKKTFTVLFTLALPQFVFAYQSAAESDAELAEKTAYMERLEKDISRLNSETARCKKKVDGWKAATVVGGIGTVGTAVGAMVQGAQILNAQKEGKTEKKKKNE